METVYLKDLIVPRVDNLIKKFTVTESDGIKLTCHTEERSNENRGKEL